MLDDLLEALSEMIEPAEDGESSHRSPEREALAVEPLEERIALAADVAAVAEAPPATESLGELQHEFALQIHESETPGTPRDGRIGFQRIEPGERAGEQGEGAGHAEHSETRELEAREEEDETLEE